MIITAILNLIYSLVNFLLSFLPIGNIPSGISDGISYIVGVMNTFNYFFPIGTLFAVLAITVTFELAVFVYHFSMWIYRLVRG